MPRPPSSCRILFQQLPIYIVLHHLHLLDGNLVELYESFALGDAVIDKNSIYVFHVRETDKFIDGGIVADIAF
jgi:hypothetical protein